MEIKIDAIGLFVIDMKRMVEFYRDVVGFHMEWDGGPYAQCAQEGIRFMLYGRNDFKNLMNKDLSYPNGMNGTFELAIDYPLFSDVDREFQRMVSQGATAVYEPKDEPWGMRSSYIADPEGNLIELGSWGKGEGSL